MKGFKAILGEFWNGKVQEVRKPLAKIVKTEYTKERPGRVTFQRLMHYHDQTPQIQMAVSSYAELITGTDMIVTTENQEAKEFLEEWIRKTRFYDKFEGLVATILICGNALLEKLDKAKIEDVEEVDMTTIEAKQRDLEGKLEYYEQRQQSGQIVKLEDIDQFIEFNLTHYSKQAWGRSLFYSLAVPRTTGFRTTAPLVEVIWGMEDAFAGIIQNNAYPITTITYPGANDEYLEKEAERWRRFKPGDKRIQKIKPEIDIIETEPASKYTDYVAHMEKIFELGTQFPHDIMTGDFTSRASSQTTETIVMKKIRGYQRYLSNKLKDELFDILLVQNGFDPKEVQLEVTFTTQNVIELEPTQVLKLFEDDLITLKEGRDWFAENTGMELEDDEMKDLIAKADFQQTAKDMMNQKQQDKNMDKTKQDFGEKLRQRDVQIDDLKNKIMVRETSTRTEKLKLTKEIMEDLKNL